MSAYAIPLLEVPLYQQGIAPARRKQRHANMVNVPELPLYQGGLGAGAAVLATTAGIVGKGSTSLLTSLGVSSSVAGPIGAAAALVVSLIAGFWAAHAARVKGAQTENAQVASAVQAFDQTMHAIFDAANSSDPTKYIDGPTAAGLCEQAYAQFWQACCSFTKGPGRADTSNCGANCGGPTNLANPCAGMPGGHKCDKSCTVSCCVGCQDIKPAVDQAVALFQSGKSGTIQVCAVASSKYGLGSRGAYSLSWNPPAVSSTSSSLTSLLTGGSSAGGPNLLLLGAVALSAWMVLR